MPEHEYPAVENPLPDLDTMLQAVADEATRRATVPPYDVVEALARSRRRTARAAVAGVFGLVLCLAIGVAAIAGAGRGGGPDHPPPAASPTAPQDPLLRRYWTLIPILTWTPDAGQPAMDLVRMTEIDNAVYSALGAWNPDSNETSALQSGNRDSAQVSDLRKVFPDAPVGGRAFILEQSVTKAQLERAAANVRDLDGVQDARVVEVPGMWFTVSATGPAIPGAPAPTINFEGMMDTGSVGGQDLKGRWVRTTYLGPTLDRATFDLLRARAAQAVGSDVSQVVVTPESSAGTPEPTTS